LIIAYLSTFKSKYVKRYFLYSLTLALVMACSSTRDNGESQQQQDRNVLTDDKIRDYAASITVEELRTQLYEFADDNMQGRFTGAQGQKMAAEYLKQAYQAMDVPGGMSDNSYYQPIPGSYLNRPEIDSENVLAFIEGSEKPEEILVLSAHYDHVGVNDQGEVFNGADDDGSGTIALVEIAEAFKMAKENGHGPKRSILFLHVTAEEIGLFGSRFYTDNPVYPLANTIANLNVDMIGRIDPDQATDPNYVYLIGSDRLSTELHEISEQVAEAFSDLRLDYTYNAPNDPNRFYFRSDHYNFAKNDIPIIFYFNGVHPDYHQVSDTPDKIEYELLQKRAQLIFHTAWELANRENRPALDE
jgi:hypothetical protein